MHIAGFYQHSNHEKIRRLVGVSCCNVLFNGLCPVQRFHSSPIRFAAAGTYNKTNDLTSYVLNNGLSFDVNQKAATLSTSASWIYGQQQKLLTNNDLSTSVYLDLYQQQRKLYYWALTTYNTSFSLKINHQLQTGGGLGYILIDSPRISLVVSDGLLYEYNDLQDAVLGRDVYQTVRNSFRFKHHWNIRNKVVLDGTHYVQHALTDINDYIIRSTTTLSIKLSTWLSITAALTYNRLSRTRSENLLINFGLSADKYF